MDTFGQQGLRQLVGAAPQASADCGADLALDGVMDAFEDAVYLLDLDDRVLRANRAFYRFTGLTPERVIGRTITSLMHPNGEEDPCPVCQLRMERRDGYVIFEPDHPNNRIGRPIELAVRMMRNPDGEPIGVVMSIRDITRARQTEREFRRLNEHIRLLLRSTEEGIFGIDADGRCTFINRAAAAMLGYAPEEVQGRDLFDLIHYADEDGKALVRDDCPMLRTIADVCSFSTDDYVLWRKDGTSFPVHYLCNPVAEQDRVSGAVVVFRNITETRAMTRKLDYLARHDTLTGLLNRHEFERRLSTFLADSQLGGARHVLCYCDLDQFKVVNDTCGHVAGDQLLNQLSTLIRRALPANVVVARLGGDEFGLLFDQSDLATALEAVDRMRETVREFRFVWEGKSFAIGVSIGVVPIDAQTVSLAAAMSTADAACYMAKDSGRNRVHVYQADDADLSRRHREMQWVTRIHQALEAGLLHLYYQCIQPLGVPVGQGRQHFEILVRMWDDAGNVVLPEAFIPAAERYDLMPSIDRWVIAKTFAWLRRNSGRLDQVELCAVNLSGHSLTDEAFLEFVIRELHDNAIPPQKICFEITETAAVAHLGRAVRFMSKLKALGCRFALDDFGSGMSSFAYLKNLPVDYLKIDGNFVRDIAADPVDRAMVEAINKVGQVMGIQTIAEFVEQEAVMKELALLGVDYVQGVIVAPPLPLDQHTPNKLPCDSYRGVAGL